MTAHMDLLQNNFHKQLGIFFDRMAESGELSAARTKSWDHFLKTGLPGRQTEVYRYVKLRKLYEQSFSQTCKRNYSKEAIAPSLLPGSEDASAVFINGEFYPELSNFSALSDRLAVLPLKQAFQAYGAFLNNFSAKFLKLESDPFAALNGALHENGAFFYLPPKTLLNGQLHIYNFIDAEESPQMAFPRMHVFIGAQSEAEFHLWNIPLAEGSYFGSNYIDFIIEEGAHVRLNQFSTGSRPSTWTFDAVRAELRKDSSFRTAAFAAGTGTVRNDYRIQLAGENAEAGLNGLWMLKDAGEAHFNVLLDHQAPNCTSLQLFKGVVNDHGNSSFEGKILVRQAAQKTNAFQLNNNLLLSDRAQANSKPNLEIFADDVKATHGATIGQLDKEQMFYLQARGYSAAEAKKILVQAFCREVVELIPHKQLQEILQHACRRYLDDKGF